MSSLNITKTFKIGGVLTNMDATPTLSDSGVVYGIKFAATDAVVVAAGTTMVVADTGTYTYALTGVAAGTYVMSVKYIYLGDTYYTVSTIVVPATPPEVEDVASVYSFGSLVLRLAEALGVAYYGAAGTTVAAVPVDVHDLDRCKRIVNAGVRMYLADAPAAGWRWANPVASVSLWPDVAVVATSTVVGVFVAVTTFTATVAVGTIPFYPSMVGRTLNLTTDTDAVIAGYTSPTEVTAAGDLSAAAQTFAIASGGAFTLPETFGGEFSGDINFAAGSNLGEKIEWTNAATVRRLMESGAGDTGTPRLAAVEKMALSRRWQLLVYPTPGDLVVVEFPYTLQYSGMTNLTDLHPAGMQHDDSLMAACMAAGERDGEDALAGRMEYYRKVALPNGHRIDARSAPRRLSRSDGRRSGRPDWPAVTLDGL